MDLVFCADLPTKLEHFLEFARRAVAPPFPIANRAALADHLGINPARVSEWTRGNDEKNREPNRVRPAHVAALAKCYVGLTDGRVTLAEAEDYWRNGSAERFRDGLLARRQRRSLFDLLETRQERVAIALHRAIAGRGMIDEMAEPDEGSASLACGERFFLRIARVRGGRAMVLLSEAPEGLYLNSPGRTHDGLLGSGSERVPAKDHWRFATPGRYCLFAIELGCERPPWIRDPNGVGTPLSDAEVEVLAAALLDPLRVPFWEWAKLLVHVG
jgi:hypothetical protein